MSLTPLNDLFGQAAREHVFPGGVIWLEHQGRVLANLAAGDTAYGDTGSFPVKADTIYDVASLTKLFTASALLIAARGTSTSLNTALGNFCPEFARPGLEDITLRHLLNHTSGLTTHLQTLCSVPVEQWAGVLAEAGQNCVTGTRVAYTCTGYYLLGLVVVRLVGMSLEAWVNQSIIDPLQLTRTGYKPLRRFAAGEIACTERDESTGKAPQGLVHDPAARAVEGTGAVSGNSGLFSTAADIARFAAVWLQRGSWQGRQVIDERDVHVALNDVVQSGDYRQGLGWHIDVSSWMSLRAPSGSAGHAGFTGPTVFISPSSGHLAVVLNNRVYPTRDGPRRMVFHRRFAEWMFDQS